MLVCRAFVILTKKKKNDKSQWNTIYYDDYCFNYLITIIFAARVQLYWPTADSAGTQSHGENPLIPPGGGGAFFQREALIHCRRVYNSVERKNRKSLDFSRPLSSTRSYHRRRRDTRTRQNGKSSQSFSRRGPPITHKRYYYTSSSTQSYARDYTYHTSDATGRTISLWKPGDRSCSLPCIVRCYIWRPVTVVRGRER